MGDPSENQNPYKSSAATEAVVAKSLSSQLWMWRVLLVVAAAIEGWTATHFMANFLHGAPNPFKLAAFWSIPFVAVLCAGFFGVTNPKPETEPVVRTLKQWAQVLLVGALITAASYCCFCMTCCGGTIASSNVLGRALNENVLCGVCSGLALILVCFFTAKFSRRVFSKPAPSSNECRS